jgi:hypothetical protein
MKIMKISYYNNMMLMFVKRVIIVEAIVFYCGLKMHSANITWCHVFITRDSFVSRSAKNN